MVAGGGGRSGRAHLFLFFSGKHGCNEEQK